MSLFDNPELNVWEKAMGWRKRQMIHHQLFSAPPTRNEVLEEVAKEFDKMTSLGDTAASFAVFVRDMKRK